MRLGEGFARALSPDGRWAIVQTASTHLDVIPTGPGQARRLSEDPLSSGTVFRVDPATGRRETWAEIQPQDPAGIMNLNLGSLVVTPDGRGYGYSWHRAVSDLYLVEGWA